MDQLLVPVYIVVRPPPSSQPKRQEGKRIRDPSSLDWGRTIDPNCPATSVRRRSAAVHCTRLARADSRIDRCRTWRMRSFFLKSFSFKFQTRFATVNFVYSTHRFLSQYTEADPSYTTVVACSNRRKLFGDMDGVDRSSRGTNSWHGAQLIQLRRSFTRGRSPLASWWC